MPSGIVALLDDLHDARVRSLWQMLEQQFGLKGSGLAPFPHITLHLAEDYHLVRLRDILEQLGQTLAPFSVSTSGLGIFSGEDPILYIPVTRAPFLNVFHSHLWEVVAPAAEASSMYYHADYWLPHLTLSQGDLTHALLPQVIAELAPRNFSWTVRIAALAIATDPGNGQPPVLQEMFELTGSAEEA
ncbi:MAG: 2'-5' RNA ligase family protein [Anaerolineae bacterium]|jgi:2'-5' RNA ligase|nr:2'-5' RNA ligase family protein [Anaerolineae bacterium]